MPFTLCTCGRLLPLGVRHDHRSSHGRPRSYRERKRYTQIAKAKGDRCVYCRRPASSADHWDGNSLNQDPANLVPCCLECNRAKGQRTGEEYLAAMRNETPPSQPPSPTPPAPQPPPPSTP